MDGPAAVWRPGSLSQAHTVDEHVALDEAKDALAVLERVLAGELEE